MFSAVPDCLAFAISRSGNWEPRHEVNVVYDEQGTILVAAAVAEGADEPVALEGERSEAFDVSDEITEDDLGARAALFGGRWPMR